MDSPTEDVDGMGMLNVLALLDSLAEAVELMLGPSDVVFAGRGGRVVAGTAWRWCTQSMECLLFETATRKAMNKLPFVLLSNRPSVQYVRFANLPTACTSRLAVCSNLLTLPSTAHAAKLEHFTTPHTS